MIRRIFNSLDCLIDTFTHKTRLFFEFNKPTNIIWLTFPLYLSRSYTNIPPPPPST